MNIKLPSFITDPKPEIYLSDNYGILDFETKNYNKGDATDPRNTIVYGYFHSPVHGNYHIHSEEDVLELEPIFSKCDFIVAQGSKFEIKWMRRCGIKTERLLFYDTMLGDYVRAGNRNWSLDLDSITRRYGGKGKTNYISGLIKAGICPSQISRSGLRRYCQQDVNETLFVFRKQRECLRDEGLLNVQFLRCIVTPLLADIELNGIFLDKDLVLELYTSAIAKYNSVLRDLDALTGGINMASAPQVAEYLYSVLGFEELKDRKGNPLRNSPTKKFPEGQPLTDEETINALKPRNDKQRSFVRLKKEESVLRKQISSYLERFMYACGLPFTPIKEDIDLEKKFKGIVKGSCILHGKVHQGVTGTHRLSSSDPNLQNLDRKFKKAVRSRHEGWNIRSADYKGLEMVIAGLLAQDNQCLIDIRTKHDFHKFTASVFLGKPITEITKDERQDYKPSTFRPLYYGKGDTDQTRAYFDAFRARYPEISSTQDGWIQEVLKTKKLRVATGLIFYWPDTEYTRSGYITNSTSISNYPIQYFATGEVSPVASTLLWHYMKALELESFIMNVVHDSTVLEESPEERELLDKLVVQVLTEEIKGFFKKVINFDINFPLEVEQDSFRHWDWDGETKKAA